MYYEGIVDKDCHYFWHKAIPTAEASKENIPVKNQDDEVSDSDDPPNPDSADIVVEHGDYPPLSSAVTQEDMNSATR